MEKLLKFIENEILKDAIFLRENRVILAFSGGPDSVFLLEILINLKKKYDTEILLYHLNHNLRPTAKRDENFCLKIAKKYNLDIVINQMEISDSTTNIEEISRNFRYNDLEKLSNDRDINTIMTAHHLNDDIETFILNFKRGASLKGLKGMNKRNKKLFRPLLSVGKDVILDYLEKNSIDYVLDETNFLDKYKRNDIRLNIIPKLMEIDHNFLGNMYKFLSSQKEIINFYVENVEEFLDLNIKELDKIKFFEISKLPQNAFYRKSIYMELINKFFYNNDIYSDHLESIDRLIFNDEEKKFYIKDLEIIKSVGKLYFKMRENDFISKAFISQDNCYKSIQLDKDKIVGKIKRVAIDLKSNIKLYKRCSKSIKNLCVENRIPTFIRKNLSVFADDLGIFFVEGIGLDTRVISDNSTKNKLFIGGLIDEF